MTPRTQIELSAWTRREEGDSDGQGRVWSVTAGFGHKEVTGMCGTVGARAKWLGARDGSQKRQDLLITSRRSLEVKKGREI